MKKLLLIAAVAISLVSCSGGDEIEPGLENTSWQTEDGLMSLEFTKDDMLINNVSVTADQKLTVEGGQIYITQDGTDSYLYDYSLDTSGNLWLLVDGTPLFNDAVNSGLAQKYIKK